MCRLREMTGRLFVTHETGALGVQRDLFKALYYTCHNIFSQRRTVSRLETTSHQSDQVSSGLS